MAISKSHWYFLYNSVVLQPFTFCLLGVGLTYPLVRHLALIFLNIHIHLLNPRKHRKSPSKCSCIPLWKTSLLMGLLHLCFCWSSNWGNIVNTLHAKSCEVDSHHHTTPLAHAVSMQCSFILWFISFCLRRSSHPCGLS
jgi:hypothetical protein